MESNNDFQEALFTNCIPSWQSNEVIMDTTIVAIKCEFNCYCYHYNPRKTEYYICRKQFGKITSKDLICCLIDNNFNPGCNHYFLEDFLVQTDAQVVPLFEG